MSKTKKNLQTAINLWLLPFLIGGSLVIGYEITQKSLLRLDQRSKQSLKFIKKEIVVTKTGEKYE